MKSSNEVEIRLVLSKRQAKALLILSLLVGGAYSIMSESLTLSTYYPAPSGVYNKIITTGNTYLARDDGNVGVGTTSPAAKFEVNGNVIAKDPTLGNHLATKAYVDAQAGGGGSARFMGLTSAVFDGNLGGPLGAGAKCQANYPGSHMCSGNEIVASGTTNVSGSGWVRLEAIAPYDTVVGGVNVSNPQGAVDDCNQWGGYPGSSYTGAYYQGVLVSGGVFMLDYCTAAYGGSKHPIACCK